MKFALLAAALALPMTETAQAPQPTPAPAATPNAMPPAQDGCIPLMRQFAGARERAGGATRLGDLPPAHLALAVDRHVAGCREATIVRRDVGTLPPRR